MKKLTSELQGLTALVQSSFPKKCTVCGRKYLTAEQFLRETNDLPYAKSGLKEAVEDDGTAFVEVFRNCVCGSTLMDEFNNRRDTSERGRKRREKFDRVLQQLIEKGLSKEVARRELIKLMHGQKSEILNELLASQKQDK